MDNQSNQALEQAREYRKNLDGAYERAVADYGDRAAKFEQARGRGEPLDSIPTEYREGSAKLAEAKAYLKDADVQIATLAGDHQLATKHAESRDRLLEYRDNLKQT